MAVSTAVTLVPEYLRGNLIDRIESVLLCITGYKSVAPNLIDRIESSIGHSHGH